MKSNRALAGAPLAWALAFALLVLFAGPGALASDPLKGQGHVQARDAAAGLVHIDGREYTVTASTHFAWETGEPFSLASLTLPNKPGEGMIWPVYVGRYDAVEGRSGLVLNELILLRSSE